MMLPAAGRARDRRIFVQRSVRGFMDCRLSRRHLRWARSIVTSDWDRRSPWPVQCESVSEKSPVVN
jgi:hypothetical protein